MHKKIYQLNEMNFTRLKYNFSVKIVPWASIFHCITLMGWWFLTKLVLKSTKSLWSRAGRFWRTIWHSSSRSLGSIGSRNSGSVCSKYSWCLVMTPLLKVFASALYSLLVLLPMEYPEKERRISVQQFQFLPINFSQIKTNAFIIRVHIQCDSLIVLVASSYNEPQFSKFAANVKRYAI